MRVFLSHIESFQVTKIPLAMNDNEYNDSCNDMT